MRKINTEFETKGMHLLMEKKINFSENPTVSKIVYAIVVAILAVSAIVVGIISAASTKDNAPLDDGSAQTPGENETPKEDEKESEALTFLCPTSGTLSANHSATVPVFSDTLDAWRIHTGIDITTDDGADVFAAAKGEVTRIYADELLGLTVEVTHSDNVKTLYSNLADDGSVSVSVGDSVNRGDKLGTVGDTSISELAEESHLHFELLVNNASVNPLDYITEESKKSALGIESAPKA